MGDINSSESTDHPEFSESVARTGDPDAQGAEAEVENAKVKNTEVERTELLPYTLGQFMKEIQSCESRLINFRYLQKADGVRHGIRKQPEQRKLRLCVGSIEADGGSYHVWAHVRFDTNTAEPKPFCYCKEQLVCKFNKIQFDSPFLEASQETWERHRNYARYTPTKNPFLEGLIFFILLELGCIDTIRFGSDQFEQFAHVCEIIANKARADGKSPVRDVFVPQLAIEPIGAPTSEQTTAEKETAADNLSSKRTRASSEDGNNSEPLRKRVELSKGDHQSVAQNNAGKPARNSGFHGDELDVVQLRRPSPIVMILSEPSDYNQGRRFGNQNRQLSAIDQNTVSGNLDSTTSETPAFVPNTNMNTDEDPLSGAAQTHTQINTGATLTEQITGPKSVEGQFQEVIRSLQEHYQSVQSEREKIQALNVSLTEQLRVKGRELQAVQLQLTSESYMRKENETSVKSLQEIVKQECEARKQAEQAKSKAEETRNAAEAKAKSLEEQLVSAQLQLSFELDSKKKADADAKAIQKEVQMWKSWQQNVLALTSKCPSKQAVSDTTTVKDENGNPRNDIDLGPVAQPYD